ncbi:TauD/TfdA family dioxygenase [Paenibacillus larvae]|uniref:TauD/TfdA family dioxygenase n=1 Tax=Paenibacillus larvae TaxID=1464 RepID=UPI0035A69F3C
MALEPVFSYTSTEYPANQYIPLHNEMSYTTNWPIKIWFYAVQTAKKGGETPLADSRKVYECIDPSIRKMFKEKKGDVCPQLWRRSGPAVAKCISDGR